MKKLILCNIWSIITTSAQKEIIGVVLLRIPTPRWNGARWWWWSAKPLSVYIQYVECVSLCGFHNTSPGLQICLRAATTPQSYQRFLHLLRPRSPLSRNYLHITVKYWMTRQQDRIFINPHHILVTIQFSPFELVMPHIQRTKHHPPPLTLPYTYSLNFEYRR